MYGNFCVDDVLVATASGVYAADTAFAAAFSYCSPTDGMHDLYQELIKAEEKINRMNAGVWMTDAPTEPGFYWFKEAYDDHATRIIRVFARPGHSYLCIWAENMTLYGNDDYLSVNKMSKAIWSGPILEPT